MANQPEVLADKRRGSRRFPLQVLSDEVAPGGIVIEHLQIVEADLALPAHGDAVLRLLDAYACDEMGLGCPLSEDVRERLVEGLHRHPTRIVFLAQLDTEPVGLAVCFLGYSTFAARPLVNIHDLIVHPNFRRRGVASQLLAAVEARARELGCCKVTLEVRADNAAGRSLYAARGFSPGCSPYELWFQPLDSTR
jgi:GNAT superfamily N-acetyltransferase